jgi:hypothetical protein
MTDAPSSPASASATTPRTKNPQDRARAPSRAVDQLRANRDVSGLCGHGVNAWLDQYGRAADQCRESSELANELAEVMLAAKETVAEDVLRAGRRLGGQLSMMKRLEAAAAWFRAIEERDARFAAELARKGK